jgi:hypothetical protein
VEVLLAATEDDAFNALVCRRFTTEFGQQNVYQVAYAERDETAHRFHREWRGSIIIDQDITLADLNRRTAAGWRFRTEPVRSEDMHDALRPSSGLRLPVALVEANGGLLFASPETKLSVGGKGTLILFEAPDQRPDGTGERRGDR